MDSGAYDSIFFHSKPPKIDFSPRNIQEFLTNKNELKPEIERRTTDATRARYAFLPLFRRQSALRPEKIIISKTLIRRVTKYGAESWKLSKHITKMLSVFER